MRLLVTGFGPFRTITDNPSGRVVVRVAAKLGGDARVLETRPAIIETIALEDYDRVVSLGVAAGIRALRVETRARNEYDGTAIDPARATDHRLSGLALPRNITWPAANYRVRVGGPDSCGNYVCNETFYRMNRRIPGKACFIHVPNVEKTEDTRLVAGLTEVIRRILATDKI